MIHGRIFLFSFVFLFNPIPEVQNVISVVSVFKCFTDCCPVLMLYDFPFSIVHTFVFLWPQYCILFIHFAHCPFTNGLTLNHIYSYSYVQFCIAYLSTCLFIAFLCFKSHSPTVSCCWWCCPPNESNIIFRSTRCVSP